MDKVKKPFHETVAEKLIEQLQEGTAPWQKPWQAGEPSSFLPMNPVTGKRYRGINAIQLMSQGYEDQRWMTYKQAFAADAQVRKGEKGTPIQYWKFREEQARTDADGKPVLDAAGKTVTLLVNLERPSVFFATVFNAQQIDGLRPLEPRRAPDWDPLERAEQILQRSGAAIHHSEQNRAFYRSASDIIYLPSKSQFETADAYYATALHELGHWTGHETRLARDLSHPFGSEGYAKEELRAEIASMILGDELGIGHDPGQHAAYVGSWIKALRDDPLEIFRAAAEAEQIQRYVLGLEKMRLQEYATEQHQDQNQPMEESVRPDNINVPHLRLVTDVGRDVVHAGAAVGLSVDDDQSRFVAEFTRLLTVSTLMSANCAFRESARNTELAAVFVGDTPAILCGGADDPRASQLAGALAASSFIKDLYAAAGRPGHLHSERAMFSDVWRDGATQVGSRSLGPQQNRAEDGEIQAIILDDPTHVLCTMISISTAGARIFDADTPVLDDGLRLASLAQGEHVSPRYREVIEGLAYLVRHGNEAEAWTLARIEEGTLSSVIDLVDRAQLVGVSRALSGMQPYDLRNEFWRRHGLPADPAAHAAVVESANEDLKRRLGVLAGLAAAAEGLAGGPELVDANFDVDELETAAKLARINEQRVRADPASTDEDISAAREARTDAEYAVAINDADLQRRIIEHEQKQQAAAPVAPANEPTVNHSAKVLLNVPFKQKDEAKALGAKWDRQEQSWYVPAGVDLEPLAKWAQEGDGGALQKTEQVKEAAKLQRPIPERTYLAVPYGERTLAKSAGAEWDKAAKSWYAGANADMVKLERWKPENVPAQQGPAMTPREEFADALRALGCVVSGEHPIMDGQKHRITVQGEKHSEKSGSGFYVGHLDGHPAGYIKNNKTGIDITWKAKGYTLDPEQKAQMAAEAAAKLQAREAEQIRLQELAAERVGRQLHQLVQIEKLTPYMIAKGIEAHAGALTDKDGQTTYVPATDADGKLWSIQYIKEDGTKRFAKDSRMEGCFHVIGGIDSLKDAPALVIGEGYATAASLAQS
ncbi:MAG: traC, partial [Hyphomicrobiales bacterium]|nr:traC [Hyphomicrobiales bacterium]